ncbi:MAG: hypothetical protein ACJA0Q_000756 [Saprospiraceae bacterium]|jgi:hypothetical protein
MNTNNLSIKRQEAIALTQQIAMDNEAQDIGGDI